MSQPDVLVVGGGPAGVAAAVELTGMGLSVLLVEQRDRLGGAIHRAYVGAGPSPVKRNAHHQRQWQTLLDQVGLASERFSLQLQSVFLGVEGDGLYLLDDRAAGCVRGVRPKAVLMAVGGVERVLPVPGWELPGVTTVGGMQVQLKETGEAPQGRILVAGSGPLPLALAAQLAAAGNPPLALLERGTPFGNALLQPGAAVDGLRSWPPLAEALGYATQLLRSGVPYRAGCMVTAIEAMPQGLRVAVLDRRGRTLVYEVTHLALHDGLESNQTGLPAQTEAGLPVVWAGDCREVLGADAAISDGRRAAQQLAKNLGHVCPEPQFDGALASARRLQTALRTLCAAPAPVTTPETVLCRCEGLRAASASALQGAGSAHEIRVVGRFAMGACQGRFCARAAQALAAQAGVSFEAQDL
ncbi:MAG: FAD-dependent oxidoreductase, partial [Rhodoferax sp.]|nr:FAD-dependent oxidoreductase [Rhodoferax sp.]